MTPPDSSVTLSSQERLGSHFFFSLFHFFNLVSFFFALFFLVSFHLPLLPQLSGWFPRVACQDTAHAESLRGVFPFSPSRAFWASDGLSSSVSLSCSFFDSIVLRRGGRAENCPRQVAAQSAAETRLQCYRTWSCKKGSFPLLGTRGRAYKCV